MSKKNCALGCSQANIFYIFPSRKYDEERRKLWLEFFDMEEPNSENIFACNRHFSHFQIAKSGTIRTDAVPDIPVICNAESVPFRRKPKNWRKNVIVVTPSDPEFAIYRHETGVFPQNLFDESNTTESMIQIPVIKSVSCSMTTQTNTRLCGSVQISDIMEEYRLNCFYCSEIFPLKKWSRFVTHLKKKHFKREEAFKMNKYPSKDHDYTYIRSPTSLPVKQELKFNVFPDPIIPQPVLKEPIALPPLFAKPQKYDIYPFQRVFKPPPPLLTKPQPQNKPFNISLADKLIKLLNETIFNPNFLHTEEDNIMIIKNSASNDIETSSFLTNYMNCETSSSKNREFSAAKINTPSPTTSATKYTRPIYTLNYGQQNIPSRRLSISRTLPLLAKNKMNKLVRKRIVQRTLQNIDVFEKVYKTVKTRPPKIIDSAVPHSKDVSSNEANEEQSSISQTPLRRCLKRFNTIESELTNKNFSTQSFTQRPMELVFEFTPENIIVTLLDNMRNYPVLWQFHEEPFNKDYNRALRELCQIINCKWSLNITLLKMGRSISRILRFYRFMLPSESIDKFNDYFDKCALFLPSSVDEIPRARCDYCYICYKKDSELRNHLMKKHNSLKWPYKCQECLERFRARDEYELHKYLPHYVEVFKCEQCHKRFNRRYLYNKHVSSHQQTIQRRIEASVIRNTEPEKDPYVCNVCKRPFQSIFALSRHEINHREGLFKCLICCKSFPLKSTLKVHLKRHRKELDFVCEVCGKGFIRHACLINHMDTHTGAKVTCNICNLKLRKCSLSRHLRLVHVATEGTIESTFRAKSYRYKKFNLTNSAETNNNNRVKRIEAFPRKYYCKTCNIHFSRLKQLKDHNKLVHSDVKMVPCKMCNVQFKHIHNLKRHYRCKHNLHKYQAFKLVYQNEDLQTVLAIKMEELESMNEADYVSQILNEQHKNTTTSNPSIGRTYYEVDGLKSVEIPDEIMEAVNNIEKEELKIDEHSSDAFDN